MSINETQYKIDIDALQGALEILPLQTELTITAKSVTLVEFSDGQAKAPLRGSRAIAKKLAAATEQFYNKE